MQLVPAFSPGLTKWLLTLAIGISFETDAGELKVVNWFGVGVGAKAEAEAAEFDDDVQIGPYMVHTTVAVNNTGCVITVRLPG